LDNDVPKWKHRWNEAHEIGHSLLPWHQEMMHGDNNQTLSMACTEAIEAEANFTAGRLLFLRDRFVEEARSSIPQIDSVRRLTGIYGNTLSTTMWRFVESVGETLPVVGMMSCHPHPSRLRPPNPVKHFIQSPAFQARFSRMSEQAVFNEVAKYCGNQKGGVLGQADIDLTDDNGQRQRFNFETFYNRYDALTLGVHSKAVPLMIVVA